LFLETFLDNGFMLEYTPVSAPPLHTEAPIIEPNLFLLPPVFALPFTKEIRKMIGLRDGWECQEEGCDRSFQDGWMVQAAHLPEHHSKLDPEYNLPSSGVILCIEHHLQQHLEGTDLGQDKDLYAARLLAATDPHTHQWRKQNGGENGS
jgi:hypothetical protein